MIMRKGKDLKTTQGIRTLLLNINLLHENTWFNMGRQLSLSLEERASDQVLDPTASDRVIHLAGNKDLTVLKLVVLYNPQAQYN